MSKFFDSFVDSVSGGLGSLATGAIGSLAGSLFGSGRDPAAEQHARNKELMSIQNRYNTDSAILSSRLSHENWLRQFNEQNKYNTPYAQFQRMLKAGLNPYVSNSEVTGTSSLGASGSGSPLGTGLPSATLYDQSQTYSNFADGISKLAQASGATIGNARINDKINAEIASLLADKDLKEVQTVVQNIETDFLPKIRDQELRNKVKENLLLVAQAFAKNTESALNEAKYDTEKQIQALNAKEGELKDLDIASQAMNYYWLIDFIEARLDNLRADTEARRAGAGASRASAVESLASAEEHRSAVEVNKAMVPELQSRTEKQNQERREISARADWQEFDNSMRNTYKKEVFESYLAKLKKEGAISTRDYYQAQLMVRSLENLKKSGLQDATPFHQSLDAILTYLGSKLNLSVGGVVNKPLK